MYDSNSNSQVLSLKFQTEGTENISKVFQSVNKSALETSSLFTDFNKVTYDSVSALDKLSDGLLKVGSTAKSLPGLGAETILGVEQKTWGGIAQQADLFNSALNKLGEEQKNAGVYGKILQKEFFDPTMNFFDTIVSPMDRVLGKQGFINKATESLQMLNKNDLLENILKNGSKTVKDISEGVKSMGEEFTPLANTFLKVSNSLEKGGKLVDIVDKIEDVRDVLETTKENIVGVAGAIGTAVPMVTSMVNETEGVYGVALKVNVATGILNNTIFSTGKNFSKLGTPIKEATNGLLNILPIPEQIRNSFDSGFSSVLSTLDDKFSKGGKYADTFFAKISDSLWKFEIAFGLTVLASLKSFLDIGGDAEKVFNNFNKGLESLQSIGIDTTLIQLRESMGAFGENLIFNIEATKQLKNITTQLNNELEKTGNYIQTLGADSTKDIDDLKDSLRDLSKELGNAVYTADLGVSIYNNLSAGIGIASGKLQEAVDVSKSAAKYAIATQGDINAVQEATIFAMQSYKKSAEETTALFNELVKQGITNTQQLQNYVGRLTAVGQSAGLSMEELFRSTALATKTLGEDAYLAIERLILSFSNMTPQAAKALEKYNLSITQIAATIKDPDKGIYGVMELLKGAGVTTASALSEIIPESVALRGALALLNTDATTAKNTLESMKTADFGDIEESFTKSQETIEAKGTAIVNIMKDVFTQAGEELEKSGISKAAVSGLDYFVEKFQNMQPTFVQVAKFAIVVNEGLEKLLQVLGLVTKTAGVLIGLFTMFVLEIRLFPFLKGLAQGFGSVDKSANILTKTIGALDGGLRGIFGLQERMNDTIPTGIGLVNTWKEGWGKLTGEINAFKQEFTGISKVSKSLGELNTSPMFNPKSNLVSNLKNIGAIFSNNILASVRKSAVEMKILREEMGKNYEDLIEAREKINKDAIDNGAINDSKIIKEQLGKNLEEFEKHYKEVAEAKKQAAQRGNVEAYNQADAELKQLDQQKQKLLQYTEAQLENVRTYETQSKAVGNAIQLRESEMKQLDAQLKGYEKSFDINTDLEKQRLQAIKDVNNTKKAIQDNNKAIDENTKKQGKLLQSNEQLKNKRDELNKGNAVDIEQYQQLNKQIEVNEKEIGKLSDSTAELQNKNSELTPTLSQQEAQFKGIENQIKGNVKEVSKMGFAWNQVINGVSNLDLGKSFQNTVEYLQKSIPEGFNNLLNVTEKLHESFTRLAANLGNLMQNMLMVAGIGLAIKGITELIANVTGFSENAKNAKERMTKLKEETIELDKVLSKKTVDNYFKGYLIQIDKAVNKTRELAVLTENIQVTNPNTWFGWNELQKVEASSQLVTILNDSLKAFSDSDIETNSIKRAKAIESVNNQIKGTISIMGDYSITSEKYGHMLLSNLFISEDNYKNQLEKYKSLINTAIEGNRKAILENNKAKLKNISPEEKGAIENQMENTDRLRQATSELNKEHKITTESIQESSDKLYNISNIEGQLESVNNRILQLKNKQNKTTTEESNELSGLLEQQITLSKEKEKSLKDQEEYLIIMNKILKGEELTTAEMTKASAYKQQEYEHEKSILDLRRKNLEDILKDPKRLASEQARGRDIQAELQQVNVQIQQFEDSNKKATEYALEYWKTIEATKSSLADINESYTNFIKSGSELANNLEEINKLLKDPKTTEQEKENLKTRQQSLNLGKDQLQLFNQTAQTAFTQNPKISESIENTSKDYIRAFNTMILEADKFAKGEGANFDVMKESIVGSITSLTDFYTVLGKPEDAVKGIDEVLNQTILLKDETGKLVKRQYKDLFSPEEIEQIVNDSIVEGMNRALANASRPQEQFLKEQKAMLDKGEQDRLSYLKNTGDTELALIDKQIATKNNQINYLINTKGIDENNEQVLKLKDELFQLELDKQLKHKENIKGILDETFAQQLQSYERFNVDLEKQFEAGLITESEFIEEKQRMQRNDVLARLNNINSQLAVEKEGSDEYKKLLIEKSKIELEYTKTLKSQGIEDIQRTLDLQLQEYAKYNITLEKMLLSGQLTREQYQIKEQQNRKRELLATIESINAKLAVEKEGSDEYKKLINERLKAQLDLQKQVIDESILGLQQAVDKQKLTLEVDTGNLEKIVSKNELLSRELELQNNLRKLEVDLTKEQYNLEIERLNNQVKISNDITDRTKLQTEIVIKQNELKEKELEFEKESILFSIEKNKLDNEQKKLQLEINKIKLQSNKIDLELEIKKAKLNKESELKVKQLELQLDRLNEEINLNTKNIEFQEKENDLIEKQSDTQLQILEQRQAMVRQNGVYDLEIAKNNEIIAQYEEKLQKQNVKNQTEELHYKKVLSDVDNITKAYEQQLKLINKQKENTSNIVDFYTQLGNKYAELSSSEIVKYKMERQIAKFKLEAYFKQQESEKKAFEYAQLQDKLAAKRLVIESKIAESKAKEAIAKSQLEAQEVLARKDATEEEKALALLQVQNAQMSYDLQKDSTKLALENLGIQEEMSKIDKENFNRKQQMDKVSILTETMSSRAGVTKKSELMNVIEGIMQPTNQLIKKQAKESENSLLRMIGLNENTLKANQQGIDKNFEYAFGKLRKQNVNALDTSKLESIINNLDTNISTTLDADTLAQGIKYNLDNNFSVKSILPIDNPINNKLELVSNNLKSFLEFTLTSLGTKVDNIFRTLSGNNVKAPTGQSNTSKSIIENLVINVEGTKDMDETDLANKIVEVLNNELIDTSNELLRRFGV